MTARHRLEKKGAFAYWHFPTTGRGSHFCRVEEKKRNPKVTKRGGFFLHSEGRLAPLYFGRGEGVPARIFLPRS